MPVGYIRVSSDSDQTIDLQRDALLSTGVDSRHLTNLAAGDTSVSSTPTCDADRVRIRLYEGEGDKPKFLGTAARRIKSHTFEAIGQNIQLPQSVSIKCSIEPQ